MLEKNKKRQVAKISVFITSIFVLFISISYAFINQTLFGTKRQVITTGNLELKLMEGDAISLTNALPMYDEVGMIQKPFEFQLMNKTDNDTGYTLKLVDITSEGTQKLDTSLAKYGLEKEHVQTITNLSNLTDGVLDSGRIEGNQTISYTLRLWIDSSVEDENLIKGKSLSYRIDVEISQEIPVNYKGMLRVRGCDDQDSLNIYYGSCHNDTDFYGYKDSIVSIAFENQISIPDGIEEDKKWDVSTQKDGSVMSYLEKVSSDEEKYKLHLQANGRIYANVDSSFLFVGFKNVESVEGWEYFDTSKVTNMSYMFFMYSSPAILDFSYFDTSNVTNMSAMFYKYSSSQSLDLSHFDTSNVTNMSAMFSAYSSSQSLDLSNFNTSNVTNMSVMFDSYNSSQPLDLSHFDTSNVTDMSGMFAAYSSSQSLDLSNFNTSNVTNMFHMFVYYSSSQPLNLSHFDTSNVTNMSYMFYSYSSDQPLDLSNFNTSNVTDMSHMFAYYSSSQPLNLSNFNTSSVTDMSSMFYSYSGSQSLDLSNFDTSNVTDMSSMFKLYQSEASLDISSFDFTKLTNFDSIFNRDSAYYSSSILVKNEAMKNWVLERNNNLTGVTIKGA